MQPIPIFFLAVLVAIIQTSKAAPVEPEADSAEDADVCKRWIGSLDGISSMGLQELGHMLIRCLNSAEGRLEFGPGGQTSMLLADTDT